MGFRRRMAIAFFARSKNFFAIGGAAQFRPIQRPAAEAALSAATVGKPYKMCGLGLSELQFAISRPDSDSSAKRAECPCASGAGRKNVDFRNLGFFFAAAGVDDILRFGAGQFGVCSPTPKQAHLSRTAIRETRGAA